MQRLLRASTTEMARFDRVLDAIQAAGGTLTGTLWELADCLEMEPQVLRQTLLHLAYVGWVEFDVTAFPVLTVRVC